jgi:hypothetical protein
MRLNFAVFTRECEPYLKVNYSNREYIEPRDIAIFFVDVGLKAVTLKKSAVSMHFFRYVKHFALKYPTLFIIPDSWDWEKHIQNAYDTIKMLKVMNVDNMVPIIVAHYFHNYVDKYKQIVEDLHEIFPVVVIGIPANVVTVSPSYHFRCINRPTVCNQYILSIINVVKSWDVKVHILGISKQTLEYIARNNVRNVVSADSDKARKDVKLIIHRDYCEVFREWLGDYDQPSVDDFLLKLID